MTHPKHVNREKAIPVRSRDNPVGDIPTDLVDRVLKRITTKDKVRFQELFARMIGWSSVEAMQKAHRRATTWAKRRAKSHRMPAHIADKLSQADLLSQALVRRFA